MTAEGRPAGDDAAGRVARISIEQIRDAIPELDELRAVYELVLMESEPDPATSWSGSAEIATVDSRVIPGDLLEARSETLAAAEFAHLGTLYRILGRVVAALAKENRVGAGQALLEVAALEWQRRRPTRARAYAAAAFKITRDERDQRTAALALLQEANASRALGALREAAEAYARSYDIALAMADAKTAGEAAIGAGNVEEEEGRWTEAADWYEKALRAIADVGEDVPERWQALLNLHIVARSRGAIRESLPLLEQATEAARRSGEEQAAPFIENARGQLRMSEGAFREAEALFRSALIRARSPRARSTIAVNLAESLLAQGLTLDAAEQARDGEREAIRAGLATRLPEVYRILGRIASAEGNADAFVLFERALQIVRERGLPALEEAVTLQAYARAEAAGGDPQAAAALRDQAARRFSQLGITHQRWEWADVYAPPPGTHPDRGNHEGQLE